ncbi:NAD(P)(+) transhydrogenase (Re/Si-specific) subunit beta [Prosthecobacter sp.]|uniref:NAD(P)(+) transhydrogenase (Re/Si-specific) subunit beta n=1 Tax=Prosthecobacter sp. TaxID=1965333 RepID=UPI003785179D
MTTAFALLLASVLFIIGIKLLASPKTARQGNRVAGLGMMIALLAALPQLHDSHGGGVSTWKWVLILAGLVLGLVVGAAGAYKVKMTAMPQMVALFNGAGGGAAALVAAIEFAHVTSGSSLTFVVSMLCAAMIGAVSLSGSIIAFFKLEGHFDKPVTYPSQQLLNGALFVISLLLALAMAAGSHSMVLMILFLLIALALGVLMVMPIGGADMPVVISLLNSFTGLAVAADGFAIDNVAMIIAGTLVGSSGTILTLAMCKAMNRPVTNVLFSAFGQTDAAGTAATATGSVKSVPADEAALLLGMAGRVVIVPGYGLAVAQAQHQVRQLADELAKKGVEVSFAIHPVAGRMPGHMNVLLAEADVPYDQLIEMETINPEMDRVDVCLVIGANDVVNPAAHEDKSSPIYGMPIIEAEKAGTVIVMKRSMGKGFAGIENALFLRDNCRMLFGDAKASLQELVTLVKAG